MATKQNKDLAKKSDNALAKISWAHMMEPEAGKTPLPEGFEEYEIEQVGGVCDTADFDEPGQMTLGKYIGMKTLHLGTREQTLYRFEAAEEMGAAGYEFAIWGSTVLDSRMLELSPKQGDKIMIRYLGESKNDSKGNPAKLFQVARLTKKTGREAVK
jgi:hypothetical protein